jgi:hypothetical protein
MQMQFYFVNKSMLPPHTLRCLRSAFIAAAAGLLMSPLALAQSASAAAGGAASETLLQDFPAGSIQSVETAELALTEIEQQRSRIEASFAESELACYPKFFATSCLDAAKEQRREALAELRPIEVEANAYKRRARAAERDKALADKRAEEEAQASQRASEQKEREAAASEQEAAVSQKTKKARDADQKAVNAGADDRVGRHAAKVRQLQAEEAANAQKRAENVAHHEKKVRQAQTHQQEIAAKKAEKERERTAKSSTPAPPLQP